MNASGSAEIVDMADARARKGTDAALGEVEHVGLFLSLTREGRGISLKDAATRMHIKEAHLAAIEEVDAKSLPPRAYALGFVKTYAEFLDLDARMIVEQFKFDAGYDAPQPIETEKFRAAEEAAESEPGEMTLPVFIAILAFIVWSAWQITTSGTVTPHDNGAPVEEPQAVTQSTPVPERPAGDIVEARIVDRIDPVYPHSCTMNAQPIETVTVTFTVTAGGRIAGERVANSTNACFDDAALNALRRWRFEPRTVDGAPRPAYDRTHVFSFQRP
ncbi:TonB family protein [Hyphococcus flavus]|uniref:TonB family protein n=1 Tax=Hyphococcus flavus TaxID=1866326 RepID=A0AAF0CBB3_9PROT|nr:TonB family protein [Hyphococcus flavus]WDI30505.1 TonB family protein [Hyphococcus flavus]